MNEFYSNEIILEAFQEMQADQIGRDKIGYVDAAMEAIANPSAQATIMNKLYKETQKIDEIDFGKIPDSKGDITKYAYYDQLYDCIELINELMKGNQTENIVAMNKLHQILLNARADFVFGFKVNNYIVTSMYKVMVANLHEMIDICIVDVTEYIRNNLNMSMDKKSMKKVRWVTSNVKNFIKMYESGKWNTLIKYMRTNASKKAYEAMALEAEGDVLPQQKSALDLMNMGTSAFNKFKGGITAAGDLIKQAPDAFKAASAPVKGLAIVGIIISALMIIRAGIKYFFLGVANISKNLRNQAALLKSATKSDSEDQTGYGFRKKILNTMEKVSDVIDYKILKMEKEASKDMAESNRSEFSRQEIQQMTPSSSSDFSLV